MVLNFTDGNNFSPLGVGEKGEWEGEAGIEKDKRDMELIDMDFLGVI